MKKSLALILFISAASVFAADITDKFDGAPWNHWNMPGCKLQYNKNPKAGIQGTPCAEIVFLPGSKVKNEATLLKIFALKPGKQYMATVMMKSAVAGKNGSVLFYTLALNAQGKPLKNLSASGRKTSNEWVRLTTFFTVPDGAASVRVHLRASAPDGSRILFDDLSIRELNPEDGIVNHFDSINDASFWKRPEAKIEKIFEENEGKEAKGCIGVAIRNGNPKNCSGSLLLWIPVKKGKEYTFVVQAKSSGLSNDTPVSLNIQGLDAKRGFLGTGVQGKSIKAENCREWTRIVFTFQVPTTGKWAKCGNLLVTLGTGGAVPGKVLFDDFEYFINEAE